MGETCHVGVTRAGEEEPCNKPAVGLLRPTAWEIEEFGPDLPPYPSCVYHLTKDRAVTLDEMRKMWNDESRSSARASSPRPNLGSSLQPRTASRSW